MKKSTLFSKSLLGLGLFLGTSMTIHAQSELAAVSSNELRTNRSNTTRSAAYDQHNQLAFNQIRNHIITQVLYPDRATNYDVEGQLVIEVNLDRSGKIKNTYVVQSLSPLFDQAVVDAVEEIGQVQLNSSNYLGERTLQIPVRFTNGY